MRKQSDFISQLVDYLQADKEVFFLTNSPKKWEKRENKIIKKASKYFKIK